MFNRYWRDYPWFLQLLLFGLMVFTFGSFCYLVCGILMPKLTGMSITDIALAGPKSNEATISASLWLNFFLNTAIWLIPPLVFANQTHPSVAKYLNLRKPGRSMHWILVLLLWAGALPVFLELGNLVRMIDLGEGANKMQDRIDEMIEAYLKMKDGGDLARALLVMALAPAIGEELFFRGILLRFFYQKWHRIVLAVMLSSLFFAIAHGTPYNYLPIFLAGVLLCITFYLTGSLFCSMLAHFFYNSSQVLMTYLSNDNAELKAMTTTAHLPVMVTVAGAVLFIGSLFLLWKNRTQLPYNWADDFTPEELDERAQDPTVL